jgi:hypothetical protein
MILERFVHVVESHKHKACVANIRVRANHLFTILENMNEKVVNTRAFIVHRGRLCQLHSQTLKPSFLRPPHTFHVQAYGFSPVCVSMCVPRLSAVADAWSQPVHVQAYGFSPVCVIKRTGPLSQRCLVVACLCHSTVEVCDAIPHTQRAGAQARTHADAGRKFSGCGQWANKSQLLLRITYGKIRF